MASFVFNWKEEEWAREQPSALQLAGGHLSKATMEGMLGAAGPTLPKWSALEKLPSSPERRGRLPLGQAALGGGRWLSLTRQSRGGDVQLPRKCEGCEEAGRPDFDPALAGVPPHQRRGEVARRGMCPSSLQGQVHCRGHLLPAACQSGPLLPPWAAAASSYLREAEATRG